MPFLAAGLALLPGLGSSNYGGRGDLSETIGNPPKSPFKKGGLQSKCTARMLKLTEMCESRNPGFFAEF
jgi:hypothetical protein